MEALPDTVTTGKGEISTWLACPQCAGVLTVHAEGAHHHLIFTCRVWHKFSVAYAERQDVGHVRGIFEERAGRAEADARSLRTIIENNRAVQLDDDVTLIRGAGGTRS